MEEITITISHKELDAFNSDYFKRHPRASKKRIEKPQHPSLNWYITANNLSVNKTKQDWKDLMLKILDDLYLTNLQIQKCTLVYTTFYPTHRSHDLDNITPKFILDGLVAGGFIVDDNDRCITSLTTVAGYDKDNPRVELLFKIQE